MLLLLTENHMVSLISPCFNIRNLRLQKVKKVNSAAAAAKLLQSCPTLSDPMDCSPPGSSAHGIFQARVLEWGAIAFSEVDSIQLLSNRADAGPGRCLHSPRLCTHYRESALDVTLP